MTFASATVILLSITMLDMAFADCPADAEYTLRLPLSMMGSERISVLNDSGTVTVVLNPNELKNICGVTLGDAEPFFDPPAQIQKIISATIGMDAGIGRLDQPHLGPTCQELSQIVGGAASDFVYVWVTPDALPDTRRAGRSSNRKLLIGAEADRKKQARAQKGGKKKQSVLPRFRENVNSAIDMILPMCMAIRPCAADFNIDGSDIGKEITFGFVSEPGIVVRRFGEGEMVLHGLAFSSAGDLQPLILDPPLLQNKEPEGMHMWIKGTFAFPLKRKKAGSSSSESVGNISVTAEFGAFGSINGDQEIGQFLNSLMECSGADVASLNTDFSELTVLFQLYAVAEANLTLDLKTLLNDDSLTKPFLIQATSSFLLEFVKGSEPGVDPWKLLQEGKTAHLDLRASFVITVEDILPIIQARLKKLGTFLSNLLHELPVSLFVKMMLRFALPGPPLLLGHVDTGLEAPAVDFGLEVLIGTEIIPNCGPLPATLTKIEKMITYVKRLPGIIEGYVIKLLTFSQDLLGCLLPTEVIGSGAEIGFFADLQDAWKDLKAIIDRLPDCSDPADADKPICEMIAFVEATCNGAEASIGFSLTFVDENIDPDNTYVVARVASDLGGVQEHKVTFGVFPTCGDDDGSTGLGESCLFNGDCGSGFCNLFNSSGESLCIGRCAPKLDLWALCTETTQCGLGLSCCFGFCVPLPVLDSQQCGIDLTVLLELPEIDFNFIRLMLEHKFGDFGKFWIGLLDGIDLTLPHLTLPGLELPTLDLELHLPALDVSTPSVGFDFEMPTVHFDIPSVNWDLEIPDVQFDGPNLQFHLAIATPNCGTVPKMLSDLATRIGEVRGSVDELEIHLSKVQALHDLLSEDLSTVDDNRDPSAIEALVTKMTDAWNSLKGMLTELPDCNDPASAQADLCQVIAFVEAVCTGADASLGFSLSCDDNGIDPAKTFVVARVDGDREYMVTYGMLPACGQRDGSKALEEACLFDSDCGSGNCNLFDGSGNGLCFGSCSPKLAEWDVCTESQQCGTGLNCCGGFCVKQEDDNTPCLLDCGCSSKACTRGTCGQLDHGELCLAGFDHHCSGDLFCSGCGQDLVSACRECCEHSDCSTEHKEGWCDVAGVCNVKWDNGHPCLDDVECKTHDCSFLLCGGLCSSDPECNQDGNPNKYCDAGACVECKGDSHCPSSQHCHLYECKDDVANGVTCLRDSACQSDRCGWGGISPSLCQECRDHADCGAGKWCDAMGECQPEWDDGHTCLDDVECKTHDCSFLLCGGLCSSDPECNKGGNPNKYCDAGACVECKGDSHCPSSQHCHLYECKDDVANGVTCLRDSACQSDRCGWGGISPSLCQECRDHADCGAGKWCDAMGKCQPEWDHGHTCSDDVECKSGKCVDLGGGVCSSGAPGNGCVEGPDCSSNECCEGICGGIPDDASCTTDCTCGTKSCPPWEWKCGQNAVGGSCSGDHHCQGSLKCCNGACAPCCNLWDSNNPCTSSEHYCEGDTCKAYLANWAFCDQGSRCGGVSKTCCFYGTENHCGHECCHHSNCLSYENGSGGYCAAGLCYCHNGARCPGKLVDGEYCTSPSHCQSNSCAYNRCGGRCNWANFGKHDGCGGGYCDLVGNCGAWLQSGADCTSDFQCASNECTFRIEISLGVENSLSVGACQ